ncbi:MAG: uroporphyrinogen-III C-methyltransferase [Chitinispirillaceae bacterium]|nr:uroporphyrinogen-III C-methyltransferase [Chitinispirillaceae bacterium]
MKKKVGRVYLIGAGPGDPDLITVKGRDILGSCDLVVYDALVSETLVACLPERIRRVYVGKRGGATSSRQSAINPRLVREARKGKTIARLKGGDPLLLGRGSEEMEYLRAHGVPYDVVPGVSSALAAPAWAGIPVTHRSLSRSVAIVTGHLQAGESLDNLVMPSADTIVFLMAMQNLPLIVDKLLSGAVFTRQTPAAIVRNGTLPDQRVVSGTLGTIARLQQRHNITAPAVVVVGESARFAKTLGWYVQPPLAGARVVVLRTPEQSGELMQALQRKGATVVPWPIITIRPRKLDRVTAAFLRPFTLVVFTSPNGARLFMTALFERDLDARQLAGKKVYALGSGTAKALAGYGIRVDGIPKTFVAEGVLRLLPQRLDGERVLIPRAARAREVLPETLRSRGAAVTVLPVYDTVKNRAGYGPVRDGDVVLFTSSSTAEFFFSDPRSAQRSIIPCCMGEITATTVRRFFPGRVFVARAATISALVDTAVRACGSRP